ncbi:MAG: YeeE/YedE family protein [Ardenticatenaceae bacterium]|nr:YeeE/YedE family protein [Anaerolineales bacterium]MCB8920104.1 YeeE/YedE family protein [Ardenticatenaceae bacterium]MCB8991797.1 YeeE/YedE family protein [Ardenticatenaceae bacterium]
MWEKILEPWPWYVTGPLIGLMVPALLLLTGKTFGISGSFRHIDAICMPKSKLTYLRSDNWREYIWQLFMVAGLVIGGFVGNYLLSVHPVAFLPDDYYSLGGVIKLIIGGVLVGFGTRYANGCTSGHTIMGLSNLRWPSLVATISFFIGGLFTTFVLWPLLSLF